MQTILAAMLKVCPASRATPGSSTSSTRGAGASLVQPNSTPAALVVDAISINPCGVDRLAGLRRLGRRLDGSPLVEALRRAVGTSHGSCNLIVNRGGFVAGDIYVTNGELVVTIRELHRRALTVNLLAAVVMHRNYRRMERGGLWSKVLSAPLFITAVIARLPELMFKFAFAEPKGDTTFASVAYGCARGIEDRLAQDRSLTGVRLVAEGVVNSRLARALRGLGFERAGADLVATLVVR